MTDKGIIPRLTLISGKSEDEVRYISKLIQDCKSVKQLILLEETFNNSSLKLPYRGFTLIEEDVDEIVPVIESSPTDRRAQVWFLFSGMGSQWSGMAKDMMKLDVFANSIKMSAEVLKPYGVDLLHLLIEATEEELNHIVAPFVTIAAIQIALVDLVKSLGITPDGIIGHSMGELGCSYADGCFTAEQMLMAAFWRGKSCTMTELIHGAMCAVELTWEEAKRRCPEGVYPVCHNAYDSVTISGPAEKVKSFMDNLNEENVFAKGIETCNIAFHSKYVESASYIMKTKLAEVISNPLPRSSRWLSSSVPEKEWTEPHAQWSSVDYHVNNLLNPVLFYEAMKNVPRNSIVIEFAPHTSLQPIVKRILGRSCIYIGLMKKKNDKNVQYFLNAVGKMFTSGLNPLVNNLYEPVRKSLHPIQPLENASMSVIDDVQYFDWKYELFTNMKDTVSVSLSNPCNALTFNNGEEVIFPIFGYLYIAWKALTRHSQMIYSEVPVIVENLVVFSDQVFKKSEQNYSIRFGVELRGSVEKGNGSFRVTEGKSVVASGTVHYPRKGYCKSEQVSLTEMPFSFDSACFYKELRLKTFKEEPAFRGFVKLDINVMNKEEINQCDYRILESMLRTSFLDPSVRAKRMPFRIKSVYLYPVKHPLDNIRGRHEHVIDRTRIVQKTGVGYTSLKYDENPKLNTHCKNVDNSIEDTHCLTEKTQHRAIDMISKIMGAELPRTTNAETTLGEFGLDSLMVIEVKEQLEEDYGAVFSVSEVRQLSVLDIERIMKK